jgi:hypothetical protein
MGLHAELTRHFRIKIMTDAIRHSKRSRQREISLSNVSVIPRSIISLALGDVLTRFTGHRLGRIGPIR